ncbi:MAG: HNH endonuclease, partial [Actinomycetota bacterium]|nr:HNH endonuclease [Actinomycetota bacterium]
MSQTPTCVEHPLLAAVGLVEEAVAGLAGAPCWSLSDGEVAEGLDRLQAVKAGLAAAELGLIGEVGRRRLGAPVGSNTAGWLRGRLLMHPGEAARAVALAGVLA